MKLGALIFEKSCSQRVSDRQTERQKTIRAGDIYMTKTKNRAMQQGSVYKNIFFTYIHILTVQ